MSAVPERESRPGGGGFPNSQQTTRGFYSSSPAKKQDLSPRNLEVAQRFLAPQQSDPTAFTATDWRPLERNTLRGFFNLTLPSGVRINDCALHDRGNGARWVGLPGRPQMDADGRQKCSPDGKKLWVAIVEIDGAEARAAFQRRALEAIDELLGGEP
jgi:hypothetical protein